MKKEELYEALNEINEVYINEAHLCVKKNTGVIWFRWATVSACLCLIAAMFIMPKLHAFFIGPNSQSNSNSNVSINNTDKKNILRVNTVNRLVIADMDVQFTFYSELSEDVILQFRNAAGIDYNEFITKIPDGFTTEQFYSVDVPSNSTAQYLPHDFVFEYRINNGGEIKIAICAKEEPLRDCFVVCDNPKQSEINDIPVTIMEYQETYLVCFSWQNINYDIEAKNITLQILEDLLADIIS